MGHPGVVSVRFDYDSDPDRYRTGMRVAERSLASRGLYAWVADILHEDGVASVLDVGCGEGVLSDHCGPGITVIGLDLSATMLRAHPGPAIRSDARQLGVRDNAVAAVAALNVFNHLPDPAVAVREAQRVLMPGGLFLAAAVSRDDSPELAEVWRPEPSTFDSEDAGEIVGSIFEHVDVAHWDAPLANLPDSEALRDYLLVRHASEEHARWAVEVIETPLTLTKRGALVSARKGSREI